jgi:hypothetical protein
MDKIVALLRNRSSSATPQATISSDSDHKCFLLGFPEEIRHIIYEFLAPDRFLLAAPHADYYGLFYSCEQVRKEMTHESLRKTQAILCRARHARLEKLLGRVTLPPATPQGALTTLMDNVTMPMTGTLIFSHLSQVPWLASYEPLFKLHLNSLTLRLPEDSTIDEADGTTWRTTLTYGDIVPFATRVNCVVAGPFCLRDHHRKHKRCIRRLPWQSYQYQLLLRLIPNIRVIIPHFERLGQHSGRRSVSKGPSKDWSGLGHHGWIFSEEILTRTGGHRSEEVKMVWEKLDLIQKAKWSRWKEPDGRLLEGIGGRKKDGEPKMCKAWRRVSLKKVVKARK